MKRGFMHFLDAAERLGVTVDGVKALVRSGQLVGDGDTVAIAGVERVINQRARSFGELAVAARAHAYGRPEPLARLMNAGATTISTENGADGGFAVPTHMSDAIHDAFAGTANSGGANILALCAPFRTPTNNIAIPTNRQPAYAAGGIAAGYVGEAEAIAQSKPKLEVSSMKLAKIAGIVVVTEELLSDSPSLGAYLATAAVDALIWAGSYEVLHGAGGHAALGILNAPATITVAGEESQTADTIVEANISKMYARAPAGSIRTSVWLCHPDSRDQIARLPPQMFTPGDDDAPEGRILSRPVISHEACNQLGDLGDILFVDLAQYLLATKDPATRHVSSVHFYFDQDLEAFKFVMRFQGQPAWSAPVASRASSVTRSPFVVLGAR